MVCFLTNFLSINVVNLHVNVPNYDGKRKTRNIQPTKEYFLRTREIIQANYNR